MLVNKRHIIAPASISFFIWHRLLHLHMQSVREYWCYFAMQTAAYNEKHERKKKATHHWNHRVAESLIVIACHSRKILTPHPTIATPLFPRPFLFLRQDFNYVCDNYLG